MVMGLRISAALLLCAMVPTTAVADGCVVLSSAFSTKGMDQLAFATAFGAKLFDTVEECNAALVQDWNQSIAAIAQTGMDGVDSYNLACVVSASCYPADAHTVPPARRVLFPFMIDNLTK